MAQQPTAAAAATTDTAVVAPRSKKKLMIILGLVLVLLAGGGAAAYVMLFKKPAAEQAKKTAANADANTAEAEDGSAEEAEPATEGHADPKTALTFVPFETFTVNLLPDPDEKFLQLDLTMEVKGAELAEAMKAQMPALRNRVLLLLTSKKASDISTPEGKTQLSAELLTELKKPLNSHSKPNKVTQVLFTSFVIQ